MYPSLKPSFLVLPALLSLWLFSACQERTQQNISSNQWTCNEQGCFAEIEDRRITRDVLRNRSVLIFKESAPGTMIWQPLPHFEIEPGYFSVYNYEYSKHRYTLSKRRSDGLVPDRPDNMRIRVLIVNTTTDSEEDTWRPAQPTDYDLAAARAEEIFDLVIE